MISFPTRVPYRALYRKLIDLEVNGIAHAMVLGGLETNQHAIEQQAQLICDRPGLFEALQADHSLLRIFTEESLRLWAPTQGLSTSLNSQDERFGDVDVPGGSVLHLRWVAANIDPEEFKCPMDLQLDRRAASRHFFFCGPKGLPRRWYFTPETANRSNVNPRATRAYELRVWQHLSASAWDHAR